MKTSMLVYRLFDVADEINLDQVEALWISHKKLASRLRLDRISARSITIQNPPVLVELGSHEIALAGKTYFAEVKARIQDLGVICLIFNIFFEEDVTYAEYMDMVMATDDMPETIIHKFLDDVLETIRPACTGARVSEFEEDFVVYYFQDPIPPDWDLVPFLLKDRNPVNDQTRQNTLANYFSYAEDQTYLAWDSAVVYDATGSMDVPNLLEFANAQFLELRYYDNFLKQAIDKTYDEIEEANAEKKARRLRHYRHTRGSLLETTADVSSLISNITNSLQVTEDIFYARIYTRYLDLLKAAIWQENIEIKMRVIQRSYNLLNEEVISDRITRMGYSIMALLVLMLVMLIILIGK